MYVVAIFQRNHIIINNSISEYVQDMSIGI